MPKAFNKQNTKKYLSAIFFLDIVQILISVAVEITIETFKFSPLKYVGMARSEMQVQFFSINLLGVGLIIVHSFGFWVYGKCASDLLSPLAGVLLFFWNCCAINNIIAFIFMLGMIFVKMDFMEESMETSLLHGINDYHLSPEWRLMWDHLQFHEECCGVHGYKDWEDFAYFEDITTECNTTTVDELFMTPFSCCKKSANCLQNYIPQKSGAQTYVEVPPIKLAQINTEGCFNVIKSSLHSLVFMLFVQIMIILIIAILIIILTRIYYIKSTTCCYSRKTETEYHNEIISVTHQEVPLEPSNMNCDSSNIDNENEDSDKCTCRNYRRRGCDEEAHLPLLIH